MATLYPELPGRRELLEALYTDEVDAVCRAAEAVEAETPGARLVAWLHRFSAFSAGKRHVASELLKDGDGSDPVFSENRARVLAAGRPLLVAAQRAGEIRGDLTLEQVLDMVIAISTIRGDRGSRSARSCRPRSTACARTPPSGRTAAALARGLREPAAVVLRLRGGPRPDAPVARPQSRGT